MDFLYYVFIELHDESDARSLYLKFVQFLQFFQSSKFLPLLFYLLNTIVTFCKHINSTRIIFLTQIIDILWTDRPQAGDKHPSASLQQGAARRRTKVRLLTSSLLCLASEHFSPTGNLSSY